MNTNEPIEIANGIYKIENSNSDEVIPQRVKYSFEEIIEDRIQFYVNELKNELISERYYYECAEIKWELENILSFYKYGIWWNKRVIYAPNNPLLNNEKNNEQKI
jgi:hypothetical protein